MVRYKGESNNNIFIISIPHLFNLYTEQILRESDVDDMGIKIGGRNITNLRYADDTALLADNITSLRNIVHRVDAAGNNAGLKLNATKTKVMHITGPGSQGPQQIRINGTDLENVTDFKCLGSIKASDGTCTKDIKCRIGMAKQKMVQLNNIWKDKGVPRELKIRILKCLIWPVLYVGEAWALRKDDENNTSSRNVVLQKTASC